jgi:hypothetical protein
VRRSIFHIKRDTTIANMAFVTGGTNRKLSSTAPEKYLPDIVRHQGREILQNHCIPTEPELWKVTSFRQFLEYRRAALAAAINAFIRGGEDSPTVQLEDLLAAGEGEHVEFKASARWDYKQGKPNPLLEAVIVKTVAGFLNAKGGTLVLGVDDGGEVIGVEQDMKTLGKRQDRDGYQQFLVNLLSSALGRDVFADLEVSFRDSGGKTVCLITARRSSKPVYVTDGQHTTFYLRTGNTTPPLGVKEATEYIKARWK